MAKHPRNSSYISVRILLVFLLLSLCVNIYFIYSTWMGSIVTSVPDGDSLQLANGRRVRLLGIDAPERDQCMAVEAREKLRSLVMSKIVKLENTVTDDYGRTLANVTVENFTSRPLLNHIIVREGLAKYIYVRSPYSQALKEAMESARSSKLGIWSQDCRRTSPVGDCVIKGNTRDGEKVYHLPSCDNYDQVIIDESYGDSWFCSEKEAVTAGFRKASGCP